MKNKDYVILKPKAEESLRSFTALRMTSILLNVFILVFSLTPNAHAEENYVNRSGQKLGRGVFNMVFSPLEITKSIESEFKEGQPFKMVTLAPARGVFKTVQRIAVGAYETVTFLVPQKPILNPPYITPSINEYAKEKHEKKDGPWGGIYPH
jgi:putative exosortase-associated protein (TIGR04073 family)